MQALGYNPYVPVMSKGGSSTSSSSTSAEQAVSSTASSISEESLATEIREVAASIEELLLSQTIVEGGLLKSEECSTSEKYFWEVYFLLTTIDAVSNFLCFLRWKSVLIC